MIYRAILILLVCLMPWECVRAELLTLSNEQIHIGLLPDCGGRLVQFQRIGGENLLHSPASRWDTSDATQWRPVYGHIIWVGPQSRWRDKEPNNWPPDLKLVMGRYAVIKMDASSILLQSEHGDTWGLQLTKQYVLQGDTLHINVTATNITDHDVTWDLWSNTRWRTDGRGFVPMGSNRAIQLQYKAQEPLTFDAPTHHIFRGWFSFDKPIISKPGNKSMGKALIEPASGLMVYMRGLDAVIQRTDTVLATAVSMGHAPVEVYVNHGEDLLEMEFHGPCRTLKPGQTMTLAVQWTLCRVPDLSSYQQQISWLNAGFNASAIPPVTPDQP